MERSDFASDCIKHAALGWYDFCVGISCIIEKQVAIDLLAGLNRSPSHFYVPACALNVGIFRYPVRYGGDTSGRLCVPPIDGDNVQVLVFLR